MNKFIGIYAIAGTIISVIIEAECQENAASKFYAYLGKQGLTLDDCEIRVRPFSTLETL